ncbi:hypothetical protein [Planotetraspora kaengkrachanensis]|uniref:Uncharacterized protein n=1 Tax=Planotetraspora kaengkrachanensis TaxID=575193 RepID=A0A8J3PZK0_9ACTN|nr:hypothetical protein [Planotetraspora kaengkrachanensis]GIG83902.1 hypothetical protein Pka01_70290 [Planotetraspora kaengkrachanensis]
MSLTVDVFVILEDGRREVLDVPQDASDLAGHERTRTVVWGSPVVRSLGARFLPSLADSDLWLEPDLLDDFAAECAMLLGHLPAIAAETGWRDDYIRHRLGNMTDAVARARSVDGGIVIW